MVKAGGIRRNHPTHKSLLSALAFPAAPVYPSRRTGFNPNPQT